MDAKTRKALTAAYEAAKDEWHSLLSEQESLRLRIDEAARLVRNLAVQLGEDAGALPRQYPTETRVSAVRRVVSLADQPVSPTDVREALAREGREESIKAVSSALSYLASKGEIKSVGRGAWADAKG